MDEREDYVRWATNVEANLISVLHRTDAQAFFNSTRHRGRPGAATTRGGEMPPVRGDHIGVDIANYPRAAELAGQSPKARKIARTDGACSLTPPERRSDRLRKEVALE